MKHQNSEAKSQTNSKLQIPILSSAVTVADFYAGQKNVAPSPEGLNVNGPGWRGTSEPGDQSCDWDATPDGVELDGVRWTRRATPSGSACLNVFTPGFTGGYSYSSPPGLRHGGGQSLSSDRRRMASLVFGAWNLFGLWTLGFGICTGGVQ